MTPTVDRKLWISIKPFLSFFYLKKLRKIERMKCFKTNCTFLKFIFGDTLHTFMDCTLIYIGWHAHLPSEMLTNSEASTALQWKCQFLELKINCLVCAMSLCDKLNIFISHNLCWQNKFWQFVVPYLAPSISALSLLSEHCPVRSLVVISLLLEVHFILHPPHLAILQFASSSWTLSSVWS